MKQGFRPVKTVWGGPVNVAYERIVIGESLTVKVGGLLKLVGTTVNGVDIADAITDRVYGVCMGFEGPNGESYDLVPDAFDGTYTEAPTGDTYVTASDNLTDKKIRAIVCPIEGIVWSAKLDDTKGTTTGSNKAGYYLSVLTTDHTKLDEDSASNSSEQFLIVDPDSDDPADSDRVLVKAVELQTYN